MKKYLLLFIVLIFGVRTFALEIVYPKKNPVIISASSTFFIGATSPADKLTINGIEVKVGANGAFAQVVPLKDGKNEFAIIATSKEGSTSKINFIIEKPLPKTFSKIEPPQLFEYPFMSDFFTKSDNIPMRSNPVDGGINRMAHLPKDMPLVINGEKNGFYRIYLNSITNGWINKTDVEQKSDVKNDSTPSKIIDFKIISEKDFCLYEFYLNKKTPFTITEENGLSLKLFNVSPDEKASCVLPKDFKIEDNTLIFNTPQQRLFGYEGYYEDNTFIFKVRKEPQINHKEPLKNLIIAVDAGHGGAECGAIGGGGDREKDINLAISKNLQQELEKRGAKVVMTRTDDNAVSLKDRVKIIRENNASISLSIHANALPDGADPIKTRGTSVYYYHNQAKPLAENILLSMTTQLGTQNDKTRQASLALVRPTNAVSVLIEVAYIINPDDYALLLDKDFQMKCAKTIADGIENYIIAKFCPLY